MVPCFIIRTRNWRRHILPKRRLTFNKLHDVMYQKTKLIMEMTLINYKGFWRRSTARFRQHSVILERTFRKLDLFPSSDETELALAVLHRLERANLTRWRKEDSITTFILADEIRFFRWGRIGKFTINKASTAVDSPLLLFRFLALFMEIISVFISHKYYALNRW
jgi:hypothetical protein